MSYEISLKRDGGIPYEEWLEVARADDDLPILTATLALTMV
jgi:hypothetical protein